MDFSKVTGFFKKKADPAKMPQTADFPPMDFDNLGNMSELPDFDNNNFDNNKFNHDVNTLPELPDFDDKGYLSDIETDRAKQKSTLDLPPLPGFRPAKEQKIERTLSKKLDLPPLPFPSFRKQDKKAKSGAYDFSELPDLPDFESDVEPRMVRQEKYEKPFSAPSFIRPETKLSHPSRPVPSMLREDVPAAGREQSYSRKDRNEIFTSVKDFSKVLDSIKSTRSIARKMDSDLSVMVESEAKKEKCFNQMHRIMEDIQRKLMLIDRALFEGGG